MSSTVVTFPEPIISVMAKVTCWQQSTQRVLTLPSLMAKQAEAASNAIGQQQRKPVTSKTADAKHSDMKE